MCLLWKVCGPFLNKRHLLQSILDKDSVCMGHWGGVNLSTYFMLSDDVTSQRKHGKCLVRRGWDEVSNWFKVKMV